MTDPEILDALRRSALFCELERDELAQVTAAAEKCVVAAGDVVLAEGSDPDDMFIVLQGTLDVTKREGDTDVLLNTCGPGEPIGELALAHGGPRNATVRAREDSVLMRIPAASFGDLLDNPSTARVLLATAVRRLEQQELQVRQQAKMAALGQLTAGLLHEANNPAAAMRRGVGRLRTLLGALNGALAELGEHGAGVLHRLGPDVEKRAASPPITDPLLRSDRAGALETHLEARGVADPWELAAGLVDLGFDPDTLAARLAPLPEDRHEAALRWMVAYGAALTLLDESAFAADRISETVGAVKAYAHKGEAPVQHVRVTDGLEQALTLLRHKVAPEVEIVRDYAPDLPEVEGYPGELNSVWTNLIDNALDAVDGEGRIVLRASATAAGVKVEVADDGPGIPTEIQQRLFDPFFTTKPIGKGTGLGLSTAFGIVVNRHHGMLAVESEPGHTRFVVSLPRRPTRPDA